MSRYSHVTETDIHKAIVVREFHPDDISALEYLAHRSRADTTEIKS